MFGVKFILVFVLLLCRYKNYVDCNSLEVEVQMPDNVKSGSSATLCCFFNSNLDEVYSIQWYRGRREFYRYMPGQDPEIKIFPLPIGGFEIDIRHSNATHVTLRNISEWLTGQFSCEVTAGENKTTLTENAYLYIYDPDVFKMPSISLHKDGLTVACSTTRVNVTNLSRKYSTSFYLNDEKVDQKYVTYDDYDNEVILNTRLLDWNEIKSRVIRCEVDLPGVSPIISDEITIHVTSHASKIIPSKFIWVLMFFSRYFKISLIKTCFLSII